MRRRCWGAGSLGFLDFLHGALDKILGADQAGEHHLNIHGGLGGVAGTGAVNAVLADEDEGVGEDIEGEGEFAAGGAHLKFEAFEFFLSFAKNVHSFTLEG